LSQNDSYEMDGYLLTYNSSTRNDITKINHLLFGRIATIKKNDIITKYYYPGLFENRPFKKISNGCYFVSDIGSVSQNTLINVIPIVAKFKNNDMITARSYWKDKISGKIQNW